MRGGRAERWLGGGQELDESGLSQQICAALPAGKLLCAVLIRVKDSHVRVIPRGCQNP